MRISLGRRTLTLASAAIAIALLVPAAASANVFTDLDDPTTIESGPTISIVTDKADYAPGELVTVTGSGWQPGESVALSVTGEGGEEPWQYDTVVVADDHGDIIDQFHIAEWWIPQYFVTATGEFSGMATTSFTDTLSDFKSGTAAAAPPVGASCTNTLTNALTSDDSRVKCIRTSSTPGETVVVSGFDFSEVPSGATNIQFAVEVEARTGPAGARAARVALSSDGTNFFPTTALAGIDTPTFASETADETKYSPGAPPTTCSDFGRSWSASDLPNLRVRVGAGGVATANADAFIEIDRVRVRVCYDGSNLANASLGAGRVAAVASPAETEIPWAILVNKQGSSPAPWRATSYQIEGGSEVCINHPDDNGLGSIPRVFDGANGLTAPAARGTYDITFRAYPNDPVAGVCNGTPLVLTLPDALTVGIFGDSFGRLNDANYDSKGWDDGDDGSAACEIQRFDGLIDFDVVLRLRQNCIQNRSGINIAGLGNIHLKYRWGAETDVASPGSLKVEWRVSGGSWNTLATHTLDNNDGIATVTHSEDFALATTPSNTSIDIQFQGLTGAASQRALVDDVLVTGDSVGTVSGLKFNDVDHNGVNAADPADPGAGGWVIKAYADGADGGAGELSVAEGSAPAVASTTTAANGTYQLQLSPGSYVICEEMQGGWRQSTPSNSKCTNVPDPVANGGHAVTVAAGGSSPSNDFGNFELASVSGIKFNDVDHNGVNAADPADPPLGTWVIKAYDAGADGALDATEAAAAAVASTTTNGSGAYTLDLPSGKYVICEELQSGWRQSAPSNTNCDLVDDPIAKGGHAVDLDPGEDVAGQDFGNFELATVSGIKFDDVDHNGVNAADPADPGAPGWTIKVFADDGDGSLSVAEAGAPAVASDVTDSNGVYSFELPSGTYVICEDLMNDWRQSAPSNDACDEVAAPVAEGGHAVDLDPGEDVTSGVDFGNFHLATVRGLKFNDVDHDGANAADPDDPPLNGWKIRAYADDGDGTLDATEAAALPVVVTQTNGTGNYTIKLPSGDYVICEELESGWRQSFPSNTKCDAVDDPIAKGGHAVDLDPGEQVNAQDFGNFELATVSGIKFNDVDHNGVNATDPDDPGASGWTIKVFADDGDGTLDATEAAASPVESQTTGAGGGYFFELPSGDYVICEELQSGWRQSAPLNSKCDLVDDPVAEGGHAVDLDPGEDVTSGIDFGNFELATVTGLKFDDVDHNGTNAVDPDDPGASGWTIKVFADDGDGTLSGTEAGAGSVASDVTDSNGVYSFELPSGDYVICEELQGDWRQSTPSNLNCDEVLDAADGGHAVDLDPGEDVTSGVDFGNFHLATVTGLKFNDVDHNGANADDPDDPPLDGWKIRAYADDGDGTLDATEAAASPVVVTQTNVTGNYTMKLPSGKYVICEELESGWRQSVPTNTKCDAVDDPIAKGGNAVDLDPGEQVNAQDFGNFELATVTGIKFNDVDHNGANTDDPDDPPLENWMIRVFADDGDGTLDATEAAASPVESQMTASNGSYFFELPSGTYVICEELQSGWRQSTPSNDACDEVDDPVAKGGHAVNLDPGEDITSGIDFGNFELATVSGIKFDDVDHNGVNAADPDDPPLGTWVIKAYDAGADGALDATEAATAVASDTTDGTGAYTLDLPSGKYVICEELQSGWTQSAPSNTNCDLVDDPVAKGGHAVDLDPGEDVTSGVDFGNFQPASVSGIKFDDRDHNGSNAVDPDDPPSDGWVIKAYDAGADGALDATEAAAAAVASDTTDLNGAYSLDLPSGKYVICEELQGGWRQSAPSNTDCDLVDDPIAKGGHAVDLDPNEDVAGQDFGNFELATVSGIKYDDRDHNGVNAADPDDPPLGTWVVKAYADDGDGVLDAAEAGAAAVASDTTDGTGAYTLDLPSGKYVVCEELQAGWTQSAPSNSKCDEVADPVAKGGHAVDLDPGEDVAGQDFGNFQQGSVSGIKFDDRDHNGANAADPADPPLGTWVIKAYAAGADGVLDATEAAAAPAGQDTTDGTGAYSIELPSGKYVVCEELQAGWVQSKPANTYCDLVDDPVAKGGYQIDLDPNEDILYKDFGNYQPGSVAGIKFDDRDKNGTKAASGEPVLGGWVIKAYADGGDGVLSVAEAGVAAVDTDTTATDGTYKLDLPSGKYVVCEELVSGWRQSAPSGTACANLADPAADGGHAVDVDPDEDITAKDFGNYRRATVTVRKTYSDGTTMTPVNVKLECTNGFSETKTSTPGSPGSPAVFTVDGFAAGDTCSVTEVSSPAGWTPDTSGCAITLTAGGAHSCTVMNVPETTIVTAGGCTFDRDTSRQGFQFPLIFTPEGGYHKLNATNPGQFFLNVAYDGDQGDDIDIYIPFPFVLNGANPIKVYQGVNVTNSSGKTCYAPTGSLLSQPSAQYSWNYGTGGNNFGDTKKITVDSPEDGLVYIRIHMAYGLKGVAGSCVKGSTSPPQATCQNPRANFLIGDAPTVGYETYQFSFNGGPGNDSGGGKVESYNEFKKNPGIGGLVASTSTGLPFTNAKADVYQGNSKVGTVYTDADGWYMWTYKYTGKATTFTVKLPNNGNAQQSATLKSNGYLNINFALP